MHRNTPTLFGFIVGRFVVSSLLLLKFMAKNGVGGGGGGVMDLCMETHARGVKYSGFLVVA